MGRRARQNSPAPRSPVDVGRILAERNPSLHRRLGALGVALLRLAIHERELNATVGSSAGMTPVEFADTALRALGVRLVIEGREHLRLARRPVVCANHPTGAIEGLALISALFHTLGSCKVPTNDLLCLIAPLEPIIVPVRHGALTRASAGRFARAYAGDEPLLLFPAGVTARLRAGRLRESPWRSSFVTRARESGRQLLPVAVSGRNSSLFYRIHSLRRLFGVRLNIEMALLVHEMYRRRGDTVTVRFLNPREPTADHPDRRAGDRVVAATLQHDVEREAARLPQGRTA